MNYWIGIISSKLTLQKFIGLSDLWFCLPCSASANDSVLIYASSKASYDRNGIIGSFKISALAPEKNSLCACYGALSGNGGRLAYASLDPKEIFIKPLSLKAIKKDPILYASAFVRKNMQATYFQISAEEYKRLEEIGGK